MLLENIVISYNRTFIFDQVHDLLTGVSLQSKDCP